MNSNVNAFSFRAGRYTAGELVVSSFAGREALSRLFQLDVELVARDAPVDINQCLAEEALLTVHARDGKDRHVHGILAEVQTLGDEEGRPRYRARLVPQLWLLGMRQDSRVFKEENAVDIVTGVLDDWKIRYRMDLHASYPSRTFCVQYRETDFAFVARLLAAEGIWWRFEHDTNKHVLVLGDAPAAYVSLPDRVPFSERGVVTSRPYIFHLALDQSVQTGAVELSGFSFERPPLDLDAAAHARGADTTLKEEDHSDHPSPREGKRRATLRLERHRCRAGTADGASVCPQLLPGATFELVGHEFAEFNHTYLVTSVEIKGRQPDALGTQDARQGLYENAFACIPGDMPWRPRRRKPPVISGVHTATVVGPAGEEIYTDKHGRIKVQFHWDRKGKRNEGSSCWVRLSQDWAGAGWGALHIPRVGMEVLVQFLDGDPDQPVVIGTLYNGQNAPPLNLPGEKTKTVVRTRSTPKGDGANELLFEDAAGREQFCLHAERDLAIDVENDKAQTVGGDETLTVEKDRTKTIDGGQKASVAQDDRAEIGGEQRIIVVGNRTTEVGGDHHEHVTGSSTDLVTLARRHEVKTASAETVAMGKALNIGGGYNIDVGKASVTIAGGLHETGVIGMSSQEVGGFRKETIGGAKTVRVGGNNVVEVSQDLQRVVGGNEKLEAHGSVRQEVKGDAAFAAQKVNFEVERLEITAAGGKCGLLIENGTIKLWGRNVTIDGSSC